jgi:hypothetical protein
MPRLNQRDDGCCFVHAYYRQHATWQIDRTGVFFLRDRGVGIGQEFSVELFMELYNRSLVYTHAGVRAGRHSSH